MGVCAWLFYCFCVIKMAQVKCLAQCLSCIVFPMSDWLLLAMLKLASLTFSFYKGIGYIFQVITLQCTQNPFKVCVNQAMLLSSNRRQLKTTVIMHLVLCVLFSAIDLLTLCHIQNAMGTLPRKDLAQYEWAHLTVLLLWLSRNTKLICR